MSKQPVYRRYAAHAERFGVAEVFETAMAEGWEPIEYARLAGALRSIDAERYERDVAAHKQGFILPKWRPNQGQIALICKSLPDEPPRRLARLLGISVTTVKQHQQAALQAG